MKHRKVSANVMAEIVLGRIHSLQKTDPRLAQFTIDRIMNFIDPPKEDSVRKTYKIELKIDFEDASRHKIAMHLMRKAARGVLTQATLIADGRQPQIGFFCDDFFEGGTQEDLAELAELPEDAGDGILPQE